MGQYSRPNSTNLELNKNNIDYQLIDIIETPPLKKDIIEAIRQLGDRKYLLNTSGKSYRSIGASSIKSFSDKEVIELLDSDSKLLKRPFLINKEGKVLIGFNELKWEEFFGI